ncbi:HK97 family phage prohead protease [Promicromonospora aerolata]|uniref:HK97 family phage prohead protease n=1 Tax=Promicromonospora aerolata TaxID=195749 RepID=A0ABW4VJQ2_9MICO
MSLLLYRNALLRADGDGRTIHGLAVPFDVETEVSDGFGRYRERFAPGAFARSIAQRGSKIKLLANHDSRVFPIGRATSLEERSDGLHAAFTVADTVAGNEALELVRSGTVDSFSVGFAPVSERQDGNVVVRTEVALREVSLVAFPAYPDALVAGIRSATRTLSVDLAARRLDLLLRSWS